MRIDIMTLFPDTVYAVLHESILGRAAEKGLIEINCEQIRDYTENKQCQVDDYPYGGGWGCVLMAQPLQSCLEAVMHKAGARKSRVIYLSPQGKPFNQEDAKRLSADYDHLVLVCGHYEGIDERFIVKSVDEEISLGDFVLTGGEIAAMAVADAVCRLVPGVLADEECFIEESHWDGLLEYPQYTRPDVWEGLEVPEVLREGNHAKIATWRRKQQLLRTKQKRPDLFEKLELTDSEDVRLLKEIERDTFRHPLTEPITCRAATVADLDDVMNITSEAKAVLRQREISQWMDEYPARDDFLKVIEKHELNLIFHGQELAGFFSLSAKEEAVFASIGDGKWTEGIPACVLHRVALSAEYRGSGISQNLMKAAEKQAEALGFHCIRTDTHKKNKPMLNLLRNLNYRYRGNVFYMEEALRGRDPSRQAYEKIWKVKPDHGTDKQ